MQTTIKCPHCGIIYTKRSKPNPIHGARTVVLNTGQIVNRNKKSKLTKKQRKLEARKRREHNKIIKDASIDR